LTGLHDSAKFAAWERKVEVQYNAPWQGESADVIDSFRLFSANTLGRDFSSGPSENASDRGVLLGVAIGYLHGPQFSLEALTGIGEFSHVEIVFYYQDRRRFAAGGKARCD
jgi:hypothetical protein